MNKVVGLFFLPAALSVGLWAVACSKDEPKACLIDSDCTGAQECIAEDDDSAFCECPASAEPNSCVYDEDCSTGVCDIETCTCTTPPPTGDCTSDDDCSGATSCVTEGDSSACTCVAGQNGAACGADEDCSGGTCNLETCECNEPAAITYVRVIDTSTEGETADISYVQNYTGDDDNYTWTLSSCTLGATQDAEHSDCNEAVGGKDSPECSSSDGYLVLGGEGGELIIQSPFPLESGHYITIGLCFGSGTVDVGIGNSESGPWTEMTLNGSNGFYVP